MRWPGADHDAVSGVTFVLPDRHAHGARRARPVPARRPSSPRSCAPSPAARGAVRSTGATPRRWPREDVRAGIAWCGPAAHLFDSTLRANLRLARPTRDRRRARRRAAPRPPRRLVRVAARRARHGRSATTAGRCPAASASASGSPGSLLADRPITRPRRTDRPPRRPDRRRARRRDQRAQSRSDRDRRVPPPGGSSRTSRWSRSAPPPRRACPVRGRRPPPRGHGRPEPSPTPHSPGGPRWGPRAAGARSTAAVTRARIPAGVRRGTRRGLGTCASPGGDLRTSTARNSHGELVREERSRHGDHTAPQDHRGLGARRPRRGYCVGTACRT